LLVPPPIGAEVAGVVTDSNANVLKAVVCMAGSVVSISGLHEIVACMAGSVVEGGSNEKSTRGAHVDVRLLPFGL